MRDYNNDFMCDAAASKLAIIVIGIATIFVISGLSALTHSILVVL
jgi:hypothetical protein